MYLKSISIENYRKFQKERTFEFAHDSWKQEIENMSNEGKGKITEKYISKSTSLLVGKNNAGKSTVIKLLSALQNARCGTRGFFNYNDFNLNYLHDWYEKFVLNNNAKINDISSNELPNMVFKLKIGIDDGNDSISSFKDILVIGGLQEINEEFSNNEVAEVSIKIKYEIVDEEKFKSDLTELKHQISKNITSNKDSLYEKDLNYRKFLNLFNENYFALNFYPLIQNEEAEVEEGEKAEQFSLAPLLKVDVVEANTVKNNDTLSKAYSKIVSAYAKNNKLDSIDKMVEELNSKVKDIVDKNVKHILQNAVSAIESTKNLQMNLYPDVTLEKIFANNIIYEYQENNNNIPETQYGMGYTNLMVIIANIVDYLELYKEDDIKGAINILCIEEPESFMHPQMQELFIKNIAKAVARLLGEKDEYDTFQILITTHSSHILNSKIQSGNSLNNIIYLGSPNGQNLVKNIKDEEIKNEDDNDDKIYEYTKKYLRLEAIDIFFADAIILVEGMSEETYIRYLIDKDGKLNNYHIKVYRIDGAYAHKFIKLLKIIGVKTVIITDLDLKRKKDKDGNVSQENIKDLSSYSESLNGCITTNNALKKVIKEAFNIRQNNEINEKINTIIKGKEYFKYSLPETNISIYSQGKINGNYATSFEEAVVLTNGIRNKNSLITLLEKIHPKIYSSEELKDKDLISNSYKYQYGIAHAQKKEKFSTDLIYFSIDNDDFKMDQPKYISSALKDISQYFEGE